MSRVLVVTNDFPTRRGGIESFILALCERLPADEVVVYTASMEKDLEFDSRLPFPVYRDPAATLLPTPAVARRAASIMRLHECDRVMFGSSAPLGLLAPALRKAGAHRVVALTHGHEVWWARTPIARTALRRIGESVDIMTYVSAWCREEIASALPNGTVKRMRPLSPGVDTRRFWPGCGGSDLRRRLSIPPEAPVVVCVARLVARKGQDMLVAAWPAVLSQVPGAHLLLVGDGPHRARIEKMVRERDLRHCIHIVGAVDWAEVPAYVDAGDVFAMPCRTRRLGLEPEAFGIVFLEAQACGLPVLVGASGGAPETVVDERSGLVVDPRTPGAIASGLVALLSDPTAKSAARDAVARVHDSWSWERAVDLLAEYLALHPSGR